MNLEERFLNIAGSEEVNTWIHDLFSSRLGLDILVQFQNNQYELIVENRFKVVFSNRGRNVFFNSKDVTLLLKDYFIQHYSDLSDCVPENGLVFFGISDRDPTFFKLTKNQLCIDYDLPSYIFFLLNRLEEYSPQSLRDYHGRYRLADSHLALQDIYRRPIIDEWFLFFSKLLSLQGFKPSPLDFKVHLSHDVDVLSKLSGSYFHKRLYYLIRYPNDFFKGRFSWEKDKANTFDYLMEKSEQIGVVSNFYFIPNNTSIRYDFRYRLDSNFVKRVVTNILKKGHTIGVHYSYNSSILNKISYEINRLRSKLQLPENYLMGGRMHYLRLDFLHTYRQLEKVNQEYDNTLTFFESGGFRAGTSFDYYPFDIYTLRKLEIKIKPLVVMDDSLLYYSNPKNYDHVLNVVKNYVDRCYEVGGTFSLLWHNSNFYNDELFDLYDRIIEYLIIKKQK